MMTVTAMTGDLVSQYLCEIRRTPLLTQEQEVEYGQKVQRYMRLLEVQANLEQDLQRLSTDAEWG